MKNISIILISILASFGSINGQEENYAVIGYTTNGQLENFDCDKHKQITLVSEPVLVPATHQGIRWSISYQFLDFLYNDHFEDISMLSGLTKLSWMKFYYGKTPEEAKLEAEKAGIYSTDSSWCRTENDWGKKEVKKYDKFIYKDSQMSEERKKMLTQFINQE